MKKSAHARAISGRVDLRNQACGGMDLAVKFSNAEVGHKNGAIDYEESIQKIPVYRRLPPQKKDGDQNQIDERKEEGKKLGRS